MKDHSYNSGENNLIATLLFIFNLMNLWKDKIHNKKQRFEFYNKN